MSQRRKRLSLGTLVKHTSDVWDKTGRARVGHRVQVGLIVGTWSFDPETNERRIHQGEDPHVSGEAQGGKRRGYLVIPSKGGGFLYPFFGALEINALYELKN